MIKFFNRIRQKLVTESKFSKYLLYAFGEIILVVIGILIALSINTWNETRKQNIAEHEFIEGIKNDLAQDKEYIKYIIQLAQDKDSVYSVLSKDLSFLYDADRPLLDSLLRNYFATHRTFYPISGSFQAAIAGNEISKFKNKAFCSAVTKLYNSTYTRLMDNAKSADDKWFYFTRKYSEIRRTGHIPDMSEAQLNELINDMYYHTFSLNYYGDNLSSTIAEIDEIVSLH
ncbi:DUF6090 family protein [Fulvivirga sedimenti]|uniref:Uncharacterized protein n=1 Tax=Fulvivirga sedimenti TaxID=2879465 RepID=A0A9X1HRS8_9BACT|nr:DUF6090 family protein [Fulvivirga sedimenti]MCA6075022.1 hypothetical protein [Fulvivirga sedimenti]MCA6076199.1 hypothetical protein [Fulvivirga sedimenti]MCA6077327.1 hypothetical protein [Fulvivirga sedimenti]